MVAGNIAKAKLQFSERAGRLCKNKISGFTDAGKPSKYIAISDSVIVTPNARVKMVRQRDVSGFVEGNYRSSTKFLETRPTKTLRVEKMPSEDKKIAEEDFVTVGHTLPVAQAEEPNVMIEFDVREVVCTEETESVPVPLRRLGDAGDFISCRWTIFNKTVEDDVFRAVTVKDGIVEFKPGERQAWIALEVPRDPTWNVEGMYVATLQPETLRVPEGKGLRPVVGYNASVQLYSVNLEPFPGGVVPEESSNLKLIWGFIRHNYEDLPRQSVRGLIVSFFPPLINLGNHWLLGQLLNNIVADPVPTVILGIQCQTPGQVVLLITFLALALKVIRCLLLYFKQRLRLGGAATRLLRSFMFYTMLELSDEQREDYDAGDISKAMEAEVKVAISSVWLKAFEMIELLMDLVAQLALCFSVIWVGDETSQYVNASLLPLMIVFLILVVSVRWRPLLLLNCLAVGADSHWSAFVSIAEYCNSLIVAYHRTWEIANEFKKVHGNFNQKDAAADDHFAITLWVLQCGFAVVCAVVTVIGGMQVQDKTMSVGAFVMLLGAVSGFGSNLVALASAGNTMVAGTAAIRDIAELMNRPTRRKDRLDRSPYMKRDATSTFGVGHHMGWLGDVRCDSIVLKEVEFGYGCQKTFAVPKLNLTVPAGSMVCFPQAGHKKVVGVNTLFSLIAGNLLPHEGGKVEVPARWKVLFIPREPILFSGSLMYNLTFHSDVSDVAGNDAAIWHLCESIGMSPELLSRPSFDVGQGGDTLRYTDRVLVALVQALAFGVDLLLISTVIDSMGPEKAKDVLTTLRQFVEQRGLPNEVLPLDLRHKKTVFYTTKLPALWETIKPDYIVHPTDTDETSGVRAYPSEEEALDSDGLTQKGKNADMAEIRLEVGLPAKVSQPKTQAQKFLDLWVSGACDDAAFEELERILNPASGGAELSGRLLHGFPELDPEFATPGAGSCLLSADRWKRVSWVFGPDALAKFLGGDARSVALSLGFGEAWLEDKLAKGVRFKLAIFPSASVDARLADWHGLKHMLQVCYPEAWQLKFKNTLKEDTQKGDDDVSTVSFEKCFEAIQTTTIADIQAIADYDMQKANLTGRRDGALDTEGDSADPNYMSLQRLLQRALDQGGSSSSIVQVRQFLWDELGVKSLYTGDGRTKDDAGEEGPREYLARNVALADIEGCVVIDVDMNSPKTASAKSKASRKQHRRNQS